MRRETIISAFVLIGVILIYLVMMSVALPHDFWINHSGYKSLTDGTHCCGNNDCFEYTPEEMSAESGGWLVKPLGELVPYSDTQASEDGKFWRCKKSDGSRRCFFAPQPSS